MKGKRFIGLVLVLLLFVVPSAFALTMADLIKPGAFLIIDDKRFYNFVYAGSGQGGAVPITAEGITVTILNIFGNPGMQFTAGWIVQTGQVLDSSISYNVEVLRGGAPIKDISAFIAGTTVRGSGAVDVSENVFDANMNLIASVNVFNDITGSQLFQEVDLANPTLGPIFIVKDILLSGGMDQNSQATLSFVRNQVSEKVPEPISLILLGSGLAGIGLVRRFRKSK